MATFVLNDNDVKKREKPIPICCVRVGKMIKTAIDSYSRVYCDNGPYHYPKLPDNLMREKGTELFKGGTSHGQ